MNSSNGHHMNHHDMDHHSMDHHSMDHHSMDHHSMDHHTVNLSDYGGDVENVTELFNAHDHHDHSAHADHSDHSGHADHSDHSGHSMMMYFHSSSHSTILFSFWQTNSILTMLVSCLAIVIMGILYEGLKAARERLLQRDGGCDNKTCGQPQVPAVASSSFGEGDNNDCKHEPLFSRGTQKSSRLRMWSAPHLIQSLLHGVQILLSYFLMLTFMTYNVWPCGSVVIGAMIGYFLFSWKRHKCSGCVPASEFVISDHCH